MDKVVFIDANIFLEIALRDAKSENCKNFLRKVLTGEISSITSDFIIYSCLLQIKFKTKDIKQMNDFIIFINSLENLRILRPSLTEISRAINLIDKYKLDFDDSLVISVMLENKINELISLDKDFDKVKIIKRIEP